MSVSDETPPRVRHACERAETFYQQGFCMIFWYPGRQDGHGDRVDDDPERRGPMVFTSDDGDAYGEAQLVDVRFCPYCGENQTPPTTRPF